MFGGSNRETIYIYITSILPYTTTIYNPDRWYMLVYISGTLPRVPNFSLWKATLPSNNFHHVLGSFFEHVPGEEEIAVKKQNPDWWKCRDPELIVYYIYIYCFLSPLDSQVTYIMMKKTTQLWFSKIIQIRINGDRKKIHPPTKKKCRRSCDLYSTRGDFHALLIPKKSTVSPKKWPAPWSGTMGAGFLVPWSQGTPPGYFLGGWFSSAGEFRLASHNYLEIIPKGGNYPSSYFFLGL